MNRTAMLVGDGVRIQKFIKVPIVFASVLLFGWVGGCDYSGNSTADQRAREERTRDEVAKATERAKPALEEAGRKIEKAANEAADQAQAAAEGVRQGWDRGGHHLVNVNAAAEDELLELPGISHREARRIVERRPYADRHDMVAKGAISEETYAKIKDRITSK
jgi:DNA uptake protein ComE-like DNA-binding protein